jgi:hypothetical protein
MTAARRQREHSQTQAPANDDPDRKVPPELRPFVEAMAKLFLKELERRRLSGAE